MRTLMLRASLLRTTCGDNSGSSDNFAHNSSFVGVTTYRACRNRWWGMHVSLHDSVNSLTEYFG